MRVFRCVRSMKHPTNPFFRTCLAKKNKDFLNLYPRIS